MRPTQKPSMGMPMLSPRTNTDEFVTLGLGIGLGVGVASLLNLVLDFHSSV